MINAKEFETQLIVVASLIGDKARSVMLWNLLDGRAYTATELSLCAEVSPQSASNHLAKLVDAGILEVRKQGRHRYYSYATPNAAQVIKSMAGLLPAGPGRNAITKCEPAGIIYARTCYDHIAGRVGVAIASSLVEKKIVRTREKEYLVTGPGRDWFLSLGLDVEEIRSRKRSFAHQCLDWTERKPHLAGALGASLLQMMLKKNWVRKMTTSRELLVTSAGRTGLKDTLGLEI
ncbi:MAG TPA: winged helix-turn-helix domain-containing protein [Candidatus Kryptobacter bacterium]|nr:winged helix-turn-helix domain-containing protein [Candidatus Kryptobacter bacterium]